jgi:hypothetical protein
MRQSNVRSEKRYNILGSIPAFGLPACLPRTAIPGCLCALPFIGLPRCCTAIAGTNYEPVLWCELGANDQRGLQWQETNTTKQPNTTKTRPRPTVLPPNITARATTPKASNMRTRRNSTRKLPTSILTKPTQRVSSRNNRQKGPA